MSGFRHVSAMLHRFLTEQNIPADGLCVTLKFKEPDAAIACEHALQNEIRDVVSVQFGTPDVRSFKMYGVEFRLESPVHTALTGD